eukprot:Gb_28046 [translate_table: standard]
MGFCEGLTLRRRMASGLLQGFFPSRAVASSDLVAACWSCSRFFVGVKALFQVVSVLFFLLAPCNSLRRSSVVGLFLAPTLFVFCSNLVVLGHAVAHCRSVYHCLPACLWVFFFPVSVWFHVTLCEVSVAWGFSLAHSLLWGMLDLWGSMGGGYSFWVLLPRDWGFLRPLFGWFSSKPLWLQSVMAGVPVYDFSPRIANELWVVNQAYLLNGYGSCYMRILAGNREETIPALCTMLILLPIGIAILFSVHIEFWVSAA